MWSLFVSLIATSGLFLTLYYNRRALQIAADSAKEAEKSIDASTKMAEAMLLQAKNTGRANRPYVTFDYLKPEIIRNAEGHCNIRLLTRLSNRGEGIGVLKRMKFHIEIGFGEDARVISGDTIGDHFPVIFPGETRPEKGFVAWGDGHLAVKRYADLTRFDLPWIVQLSIEYGDHFGVRRETGAKFAFGFDTVAGHRDFMPGDPEGWFDREIEG